MHTPFKQKFGIPRQPGVVSSARGVIELLAPFDRPEMLMGLEAFSHLWIIWRFHGIPQEQWKPTVRPPRLGGNKRVGVFASRSPYRPNPIALSVVKLDAIDGSSIEVSGVDMMEGTPVLDIKPYVPYADCIPQATQGFAKGPPEALLGVTFSETAESQLQQRDHSGELRQLIVGVLQIDPRPAYKRHQNGEYGFRLHDFDLRWSVSADQQVEVLSLDREQKYR